MVLVKDDDNVSAYSWLELLSLPSLGYLLLLNLLFAIFDSIFVSNFELLFLEEFHSWELYIRRVNTLAVKTVFGNGNYEDPLNTINCTEFDFDNLTLVNGLDHLKCQNLCHQSPDCKLYKFKKV